MERRTEAETEDMRGSGRFPFVTKTTDEMLTISSSPLAGLKKGHETIPAAAEERYFVEGIPQILSDHAVWDWSVPVLFFSNTKRFSWSHPHGWPQRVLFQGGIRGL